MLLLVVVVATCCGCGCCCCCCLWYVVAVVVVVVAVVVVSVVVDARITCYPMQYVRFHLQHTAFSALLAVCKLSWLSSCACQVYMFVLLCIT